MGAMDPCPNCFQQCFTCSENPELGCAICTHLQNQHWQHFHTPFAPGILTTDFIYSSEDIVLNDVAFGESAHQGFPNNLLQLELPSATSTEVPAVRRRHWTNDENRDFEQWITNNPKPTKPQKVEFATSHQYLTLSQVQNKINNWRNGRNGRNVQNQTVSNTGADREGLLNPPQGLEFSISAPSCTTNSAMPITQGTVATVDTFSVPSELFDNMRSISPVSSILRYIDSPELEADRDAIERAFKTASDECLRADHVPSPCMRLPSLSHQGSSEKLSYADPYLATVQPRLRQDQSRSRPCERCIEQGLSCSPSLPCQQCDEAEIPCSNCLRPVSAVNIYPHNHGHADLQRRSTHPLQLSPTQLERLGSQMCGTDVSPRSQSGRSVGSARTSRSGVSTTYSARYSIKLNRRFSATNRRHSEVEIQPAKKIKPIPPTSISRMKRSTSTPATSKPRNMPSNSSAVNVTRLSLTTPNSQSVRMNDENANFSRPSVSSTNLTRDPKPSDRKPGIKYDGRANYFMCPDGNCWEIFDDLEEVKVHVRNNHFRSYCTFCRHAFANMNDWRSHENQHAVKKFGKGHGGLLWLCGICSIFGLAEHRRYQHIQQHWKDGQRMDARAGDPKMLPLSKENFKALENMEGDLFELNAEYLLSKFGDPWSSPGEDRDHSITLPGQRPYLSSSPKVRVPSRHPASTPLETLMSRPILHGLFASLRRRLPMFRTREK
ncbi:uncharacterized protein LY89DRAFT_713437 [Mollisia scopiformis]|uniref:C2H2-type domain-containing protein n=1 Tax=Mollisia scopiformis TaxID=149040 RepID=A0A194XX29_MOLSC|nr:uncharacterized protein LY89DRAFT_713437 [Mollisia scopiformis]KUJ24629.1 hypothetical protein LY89DRAFT_713437 [Mollisia scopiformis]